MVDFKNSRAFLELLMHQFHRKYLSFSMYSELGQFQHSIQKKQMSMQSADTNLKGRKIKGKTLLKLLHEMQIAKRWLPGREGRICVLEMQGAYSYFRNWYLSLNFWEFWDISEILGILILMHFTNSWLIADIVGAFQNYEVHFWLNVTC